MGIKQILQMNTGQQFKLAKLIVHVFVCAKVCGHIQRSHVFICRYQYMLVWIQYIVSICVLLLKKVSLGLHLVDPVNATTQAAARPIEQ